MSSQKATQTNDQTVVAGLRLRTDDPLVFSYRNVRSNFVQIASIQEWHISLQIWNDLKFVMPIFGQKGLQNVVI